MKNRSAIVAAIGFEGPGTDGKSIPPAGPGTRQFLPVAAAPWIGHGTYLFENIEFDVARRHGMRIASPFTENYSIPGRDKL